MKKIISFLIFSFLLSVFCLQAQHLFSVIYNDLPQEKIQLLKTEMANKEISSLSLTRNNENKEIYSVSFSSVENTKLIILNEQTGAHVVIIPSEEWQLQLMLAPFFMEELKQAVLGEANQFLILETTSDLSVRNIHSVVVSNSEGSISQFFYGKKENVQEALPKDRQILHIFKEKPRYFPAFPEDPENLLYVAQLEEEMSYYVYMYQLPDGMLCVYDEHFIKDNNETRSYIGGNLEFELTGSMNAEQREATEYALELWGEQLGGRVPPEDVRVRMDASVIPIDGSVLGRSYRQPLYLFNNTYYCSAIGNQMAGYYVVTNKKDIVIEMNSNQIFYLGVDGKTPSSAYDYLTIMLHEVTHGLGFFPTCNQNGQFTYVTPSGTSQVTSVPGIFDRQLFQGLDGPCLSDLTQAERKSLTISNNLYAGAPGSNLLAANEGVRVKMYAPTTYNSGSSNSHWDNSVSFKTFMKYSIGKGSTNSLHTFNTRKIGILLDLGWTLPVPDPNTRWVTFMANSNNGDSYTQQFLPGVEKKLKPNSFKRDGYTFINWNTKANGTGTSYEERKLVTIPQDLVLYAQWNANTYTLLFNPSGGTVNITSKQVTFDAPVGELPTPVREGWIFKGWFIGSNLITEETIWKYPEDKRSAMAKWERDNAVYDTQKKETVQIIPNPASHSIELRITNCDLRIENIKFYNIFGQVVKTVPFAGETSKEIVTQKIDISELCAGLYMVKAGEKTVKLIVN